MGHTGGTGQRGSSSRLPTAVSRRPPPSAQRLGPPSRRPVLVQAPELAVQLFAPSTPAIGTARRSTQPRAVRYASCGAVRPGLPMNGRRRSSITSRETAALTAHGSRGAGARWRVAHSSLPRVRWRWHRTQMLRARRPSTPDHGRAIRAPQRYGARAPKSGWHARLRGCEARIGIHRLPPRRPHR